MQDKIQEAKAALRKEVRARLKTLLNADQPPG